MNPQNYITVERSLQALTRFLSVYEKNEAVESIDELIRTSVISGNVREYNLEESIALLFDLRDMMKAL